MPWNGTDAVGHAGDAGASCDGADDGGTPGSGGDGEPHGHRQVELGVQRLTGDAHVVRR